MPVGALPATGLHRFVAVIIEEHFDISIPGIIEPRVTRLLVEQPLGIALCHHVERIAYSSGMPGAV